MIGLIGGIGSGKSFVAGQFVRIGCAVIDSDKLGHEVLKDPEVIAKLVRWWGGEVLDSHRQINRQWVARKVFSSPIELRRLQKLVHPKIAILRDIMMRRLAMDNRVKAVVFDAPLLLESGVYKQCDAIIFVKTLKKNRLSRMAKSRGWGPAETTRREKFQMPLDKKKQFADYTIDNDGDLAHCVSQVRDVFFRVLTRFDRSKRAGGRASAD
ncbi:MAG TPA: dephospho-CoA kinase [Phycisphaerae bacterium]|nr:dephospho-CoA kinase [Phycisphaerae bacterium]